MEARVVTLEQAYAAVEAQLAQLQQAQVPEIEEFQPISPRINNANEISLRLFERLLVFNGDTSKYRTWMATIISAMSPIEAFRDTKPYYDALFIIRHTKIEGEPATLLQNHGTVFHLQAILNRLDYSYADTRSYNALIEEMKRQIQGRQTLSEFHSKICQIFNLAMTKCEIDYPGNTHSLQQVTKEMAIDCSRNGINDEFTQHPLYAAKLRDLESAYAIATEILYKRQNNPIRREAYNYPKHPQNERKYQPGVQPIPHIERSNPTPMDVDTSIGRFRQPTNNQHQQQQSYQQNPFRNNYERQRAGYAPFNSNRGEPFKRNHQPTSSRYNIAPQKLQRINQITDNNSDQSLRVNIDESEFENRATFLDE
ncbi:uncharacterized protein LOC118736084 [Rhagoletis pomonella]|uniref:uncharacterized protein LOC118736084 n=1 Tax=Rhagoletis pomonella TaxID=28610 RepID=UPI00177D4DDB|nr:uncharacterized protein LOC118736084 [Rhagoletis pomonella]